MFAYWLTRSVSRLFLAVAAFALLGLIFRVGFEKNLVRTVTPNEWGRTLYGVAAAITQHRFHVGWFAVDTEIEAELQRDGLTGNPQLLTQIGLKFPTTYKTLRSSKQRSIKRSW